MSGEVVNLNRARKQAARKAVKVAADSNAAKFGRTKAERALEAANAEKATRDHAGHKRDAD